MQKINLSFKQILLNLIKITSVIVVLFALMGWFFSHICFNVTISEPTGYYFTYDSSSIKRGDKVLICVDDIKSIETLHKLKLPYELNRCKLNTPYLIKTISGIPGDQIDVERNGVYINNQLMQNSIALNNYETIKLNPMPFGKFKLSENEYFMLGNTPHSYDSRYFGIVKFQQIKYKAILLWKRQHPLWI